MAPVGTTARDTYHTHVWPEHLNLHIITPSTARSKSASSNTMNGALPPSSKLTLFNTAILANIFPTPVEPVNDIFLTDGFVHNSIAAPLSFVGSTWIILEGIPESMASLVKAAHVNGVSLGGLMTTAQPAAKAGAIFRVIIAAGKFQGVMMPQTPTGSLYVSTVVCGVADGIVSPYARGASSANQATNEAA